MTAAPKLTLVASPAPDRPTVLLVDDDEHLLESLALALHAYPFTLVRATSAERAAKVVAQRPIDVVVCDERMPGTSGSQFLARLTREQPAIMRIMLTGAGLPAAMRAVNDAAVFRLLIKPCPAATIAQAISDAVLAKLTFEGRESIAVPRPEKSGARAHLHVVRDNDDGNESG